jgi:short subunit dehydrogenase-like uncharacterized protein
MAGRIVVFGATGYTGRLVCEALLRRGSKPVLAARSAERLGQLASDLGGGLETATADVSRPETVRALVERGDVLVSTVGPFVKWGAAGVEAAVAGGAHYLDSTGEPPFIREVFERWGGAAQSAGCGLLTAFGYDFVPGNLAAALALERAGEQASAVHVGYFFSGSAGLRGAASGGTLASLAGVMLEPQLVYRDGRLQSERSAARVRSFSAGSKKLTGVSIGASEHFALPRLYPKLREVDVYLGWFGPLSRGMQAFTAAGELAAKVPGFGSGASRLTDRFIKGSSGGPDAEARAQSGSRVFGEARDASGTVLAQVELRGPNGYTFTGDVLAWGAQHIAEHGLEGTGALGPVDGFGLRTLEAGCAEVGLAVAAG